jgi:hypothetical protein
VKQQPIEQMFESWLETVPEHPDWTHSQIKALIMLDNRMLNVLEPHGLAYDGFSWRPGVPYGILCLKTTYQGEAYVTFITERSLSICVGILGRMLKENRLVLKPDKYRGHLRGKDQVV